MTYLLRLKIALLICFACQILFAQEFTRLSPEFYKNGRKLINATMGGIRNAQFSNIDLDGDGVKDIFVFDRVGDKISCFINKSDEEQILFEYAPQYETYFPKTIVGWALVFDFNKDGIEDIFGGSSLPGIQVWKGFRKPDGSLSYQIVKTEFYNILTIFVNNNFINLYNANSDLPAVYDVDNDGDVDILTFDPDGIFVSFYRNLALEQNKGLDTFIMKEEEICFGKFSESMFNQELYLSSDGISCGRPVIGHKKVSPRHSGSTVTAFDFDCDNDTDLLLGDIANKNIVYLENGGSVANSYITKQILNFPDYDVPVDMNIFLSAFILDVNNDGKKDMIVTPNEFDNGLNNDHIWLYINEGTACEPFFSLKSKNFLVDHVISTGARSDIAFLDVNADGLEDIIISGRALTKPEGGGKNRISYYKNIGTKSDPKFNLENDDFLSFSNINAQPTTLNLTAGDIDGDKDSDILIGDSNGKLYFFENSAGPGKPVVFLPFQYEYKNIFVGQAANPFLFDADTDGLNDLIIGEQNNELNYFRNIGIQGKADFDVNPNDKNFGKLFTSQTTDFKRRNANISLFKTNNGKTNALISFSSGLLSLYELQNTNGNYEFKIIKDSLPVYSGVNVTNAVSDINNDGQYEMFFGNHRGGIEVFQSPVINPTVSFEEEKLFELSIYPNPVKDLLYISFSNQGLVIINNILGHVVLEKELDVNETSISVQQFPDGIYFLNFFSEGNRKTIKFVKY